MTRLLVAALFGLAVATTATAEPPPPPGKATEYEFTPQTPKAPYGYYREFDVPITQGDRFRFQLAAANAADMKLCVCVLAPGQNLFEWSGHHDGKVDWTMTKVPSGRAIKVRIQSLQSGKVSFVMTRLGPDGLPVPTATAAPASSPDDELRRLRAENADLRRQVEDLRRLLEQKK